MPHPLDPPIQWAAAATAGKLVAQGVLAAEDIIPDLCRAAVKAGYSGHKRGLLARMTWQVNDTANHWRQARERAEWLIGQEVWPLLVSLTPVEDVHATAFSINEKQGEPLLRHEVRALVEGKIAAFLSTLKPRAPHKGRRRHVR